MPVNYEEARRLLDANFASAEEEFLNGRQPADPGVQARNAIDRVFASTTQAYREVLLGCTLARMLSPTTNIRQPYSDQGPNAFSGRSLDERVVNPFLHDKRIPCSRGPYLAVFRRSVQFTESTRVGLRDGVGYDALLDALSVLESCDDQQALVVVLHYILHKFVELRESANIPLLRIQRISLEQYDSLIARLLNAQSRGLFPLLLVVAMLRCLKRVYQLDWDIAWQGINVADRASGACGDVTVRSAGQVVMAVEVTERPVGRARVVATFNTKIAPAGIEDYLFIGTAGANSDACAQARQYFAQGHEVVFVEIREWLLMLLATTGRQGRQVFNSELMELLEGQSIPTALRVTWNESINAIVSA